MINLGEVFALLADFDLCGDFTLVVGLKLVTSFSLFIFNLTLLFCSNKYLEYRTDIGSGRELIRCESYFGKLAVFCILYYLILS